jgi:SanA protein
MIRRRTQWLILGAAAGILALPLLWYQGAHWHYGRQVYSAQQVRQDQVAIVFGARIYADGRLSPMLRDRVETAVELYQTGKVEKLLFSGDNRFREYDEPGRMRDYALSLGVPSEDIQPDYAGRRTYDTCYRAKAIFKLESAILITQDFHLPRALFTCDSLGLDVVGVAADKQTYSLRSIAWSTLREIPALSLALIDVLRQEPPPVLGEPIPIE